MRHRGRKSLLARLRTIEISEFMSPAEKALLLATAKERAKIIYARLQVVNKELEIAMLEMVALQAQLGGHVAAEVT